MALQSNRNGRLDGRVRIVAKEFEVFVLEVVDVFDGGIEAHLGQGTRLASELGFGLLKVVGVEMKVAERVDKCARFQIANLRSHEGEQGVGSDVERDAKEEVGAALIELAAQLTVLNEEL